MIEFRPPADANLAAVFSVTVDPPQPGRAPEHILFAFSTGNIRTTTRAAKYLHGRLAAVLAELPEYAP